LLSIKVSDTSKDGVSENFSEIFKLEILLLTVTVSHVCTVACERSVSRAEVQNNAEIGAEWAENRVIRSGNSASFAYRPMSGRRTDVRGEGITDLSHASVSVLNSELFTFTESPR